jgi:hypothetical protein
MAQLAGRHLREVAIDVDEVIKKGLRDVVMERVSKSAADPGEGRRTYLERAIGNHLEPTGGARDEMGASSGLAQQWRRLRCLQLLYITASVCVLVTDRQ